MRLQFKRITASGNFIPEIDGLRFIAIISVLLYHISGFINIKYDYVNEFNLDYSFIQRILNHGDLGVPLFFVISGFILGLPFAKFHIKKGKEVNLKKYFIRRLTRLEPLYIIIMTVLFFGTVYIAKTLSLNEGVMSYLASITYLHEYIYEEFPKLNVSAWSLEVEVQFYILAPLIACLFYIKSKIIRRTFIISIIIIFSLFNFYYSFSFRNLVGFIHYFLVGFLLVDLYVTDSIIFKKTKFDFLIGLPLFLIIWVFDITDFNNDFQKILWELFQLSSIFFLYYYILFHKIFKLLSFKLITNIGGMCYSIYLVHYPVISMFGNPLLKLKFSNYDSLNILIYTIILLTIVMLISSLVFILIERPTMDKDWPKKLLKKLNHFL